MIDLQPRPGPQPRTTQGLPHSQIDQQPTSDRWREELARRVFALSGVTEEPSGVSVPGARGMILEAASAHGPHEAFFVGHEFAHLHPGADHSLHMCLPESLAAAVCATGWGEPHPLVSSGELPSTIVMVYAPRDQAELEVICGLVRESLRFALGTEISTPTSQRREAK